MDHEARHNLEDLLGRQITAAQCLAQTLAAERTALTGDSPDAVKEMAAEKIRVLGSVEKLEGERRALWGACGADGAALGEAVADRWRKLMELMAGCRTANEVNGHIIHIRQNQVRQLFDIVRGGAPVTYGPEGKTFARALRALARA
ncbi:MAG: hypothetical protein JWN43_1759 [Gammaproteobacteria bacterium]|nr:hypothetical protein [Gammaproteobacteria bacterium]